MGKVSLGAMHQHPSTANGRSNKARVELPVLIFSERTDGMPSTRMSL